MHSKRRVLGSFIALLTIVACNQTVRESTGRVAEALEAGSDAGTDANVMDADAGTDANATDADACTPMSCAQARAAHPNVTTTTFPDGCGGQISCCNAQTTDVCGAAGAAWCNDTNVFPNCTCTSVVQVSSQLVEAKKGAFFNGTPCDHSATQVKRSKRLLWTNAAGQTKATFMSNPKDGGACTTDVFDVCDNTNDGASVSDNTMQDVTTLNCPWTSTPANGGNTACDNQYVAACGCDCTTVYGAVGGWVCNDATAIQLSAFRTGTCNVNDPACSEVSYSLLTGWSATCKAP
jgi:hypothetical protein